MQPDGEGVDHYRPPGAARAAESGRGPGGLVVRIREAAVRQRYGVYAYKSISCTHKRRC